MLNIKCACCGEDDYDVLVLAYNEGIDGKAHRKENGIKSGQEPLMRWAKKNGFPPIFRVLCSNCDGAIRKYGYCPHQFMDQDVVRKQTQEQSVRRKAHFEKREV